MHYYCPKVDFLTEPKSIVRLLPEAGAEGLITSRNSVQNRIKRIND